MEFTKGKKRILICPLNWGLGHATRCIPIINELIKQGHNIVIAADEGPLKLLQQEFPTLTFIVFPNYSIRYPSDGNMIVSMLVQSPRIVYSIYKEHSELKKIISTNKIEIVISDNRFGLWNKVVKSIFITHQLFIKTPIAQGVTNAINHWFIKKYDECWVPDIERENNLSGELSHGQKQFSNVKFIGALSRFNKQESGVEKKWDVLVILSGPEPQRSIFENIVLQQLKQTSLKTLIVKGIASAEEVWEEVNSNITSVSHLPAKQLETAILSSEIIVSRSGYSTIMDLVALGKKAIFVPTPGQTEQEYLAQRFMKMGICFSQTQQDFNLEMALKESEKFTGFKNSFDITGADIPML
jgi:uncharacterized protein (TIGR00661 family)